jgi:hypothetical protein
VPAGRRPPSAASYCGFSFGSASGGLQMEKGPSLGLGLASHCAPAERGSMTVGRQAQSVATFSGAARDAAVDLPM